MGDIFLNHKYTFEELLNSEDPYTIIFLTPARFAAFLTKTISLKPARKPPVI
jgi:conjugal transfer mating pair stabilization protein TraG